MSPWRESAHLFECEGNRLLGIANIPASPFRVGVLIIVGGPQYRSGSHRQFTLLARQLSNKGIASFRFDYRGMGDSEGAARNFEDVDQDIHAAIDTFMTLVPELKEVALWGLCDAASAALIYGNTDSRVTGMVLLNPWVHTDAAEAKARLHSYYPARMLNPGFWRKLLSFKLNVADAVREIHRFWRMRGQQDYKAQPFVGRMLSGLEHYSGQILILLSGQDDLTVQEFKTLTHKDPGWHQACQSPKLSSLTLHGATHTFSSKQWRDQVGIWTESWIRNQISNRKDQPLP